MTDSPDFDTMLFDAMETVNGGARMDSDRRGGYEMNEGAEARKRKQREMNKHRDAAAARERMIRRQLRQEENDDKKNPSGTSKIPLWSK